jgi:undecaprenyl-diphosphatase
MSRPLTRQERTAEATATRAGARLVLALLGALAVLLVAVPLTLLVRTEYPPLVGLDQDVTDEAEQAVDGSTALLRLAQALTLLGDPVGITVVAAVIALVLWRRGDVRLALFVVAARVGALALSQGLKHLVDRARPVFDVPVATALGPSFPSGHAIGSAVFWTTTAVLLMPHVRRPRLLLAGAVLVAVLVAASRVLLGVHFLSDVSGGLLLGLGWAGICTAVFVAERAERGRPVEVESEGIGA